MLSDVLKQVANRVPLRAGISLPFSDLQSLGEARDEARQALALAGERQVVRLSKVRLFDYLLARPSATTRKLVPARLVELDEVHRATLRYFALANLNAEQAARALGVHANTVTYRLRKVQELTGLDVRRLEDLIDLLAGVRILDLTEGGGQRA
jgi:sugar diacid utilization regulator